MTIDISSGFSFVPKWGGNDKLPKEQQGLVHCKFLSVKETKEIIDKHGQSNAPIENFIAYTRLENFKVTIDGKEKEISARDCIDLSGLDGLFLEIVDRYQSASAVDKKK